MSKFNLEGKVSVITGAASGIGRAIAMVFAMQGSRVHLLDTNLAGLNKLAESLSSDGHEAKSHQVDVTDQNQVISIFDDIESESPINILVNNAGIGFVGKLEHTTEVDFDRLYQVNVKGVYNGMYACVPHMKQNGGGVILNMASVVASVGIPERFGYTMTKGAVVMMTYSVALDYIKDGIRCNCISPARVHTSLIDDYLAKNYPGREKEVFEQLAKTQPIGRMAKPEEVAHLALYLCSDEAAFITGSDFPIDGGFIHLIP
ncbi:MAG: SDR family oxidoreductase [Saprospiraceae bacterium]|nr:SDR family oxidoreductase [Saprospiraceae bacterium]